MEPYLAIVVDPHRTMSAGKVEIGCFRTYSKDEIKRIEDKMAKDGGAGAGGKMAVPIDKIEELGNHWYKYYQLEHSFFKSSTDNIILEQLWNEYWLGTLSSSPFLNNQVEITNSVVDINSKIETQSKDAGNAMNIAKVSGQF
jgi:COP9 signalosome complex subunit 5